MKDKELPSDEELIQFYKSKTDLLAARVEYARLDTELAELSARKYEALAKLAYIQNSQSKETKTKEEDGNKSTSS